MKIDPIAHVKVGQNDELEEISDNDFPEIELVDTIAAIDICPGGHTFDLQAYRQHGPRRIRISIDRDGVPSVDAKTNYWLLAEVDLEGKQYETEPVMDEGKPVLDEFGTPKTITTVKKIALKNIKLTSWKLPKQLRKKTVSEII